MMNKRGGPPIKAIVFALFLLGGIYFIYLYHVSQNRLRDAEMTADRYRREDELKVSQLQELMKSKEDLQDKCDSDRQEFVNRVNSCNQQSKMLKNQHEELEGEYGRLQQEVQKLREDSQHLESQRSQEFSQMKQQKELEIATLKNQVADLSRQNEQLQNEISSLKAQLQNSQQSQQALQQQQNQQAQQQQNQQLQQQQQQQQQQPVQPQGQFAGVQQQDVGQQGLQQNLGGGQAGNQVVNLNQADQAGLNNGQAQGQQGVNHGDNQLGNQGPVDSFNIPGHQANVGQNQQQQQQPGGPDNNGLGQGVGEQGGAAQNNAGDAQHQVLPPNVDSDQQFDAGAGDHNMDAEHDKQNAADDKQGGAFHDNRIVNEGPVNLQVQEPALPGQNVQHDSKNDKAILNQEEKHFVPPLQPQGQGHMPGHLGGLGPGENHMGLDGNLADMPVRENHAGEMDGNVKVEGEGRKLN